MRLNSFLSGLSLAMLLMVGMAVPAQAEAGDRQKFRSDYDGYSHDDGYRNGRHDRYRDDDGYRNGRHYGNRHNDDGYRHGYRDGRRYDRYRDSRRYDRYRDRRHNHRNHGYYSYRPYFDSFYYSPRYRDYGPRIEFSFSR